MSDSSFRPPAGIITPMVTPLAGQDQLDLAGLERLVEHILAGGVQGLFILGTTGEGPSVGQALRRELINQTCRLVARRVPVLVGVSDTSYTESIALARHAEACGADLVVLAPPYYVPAGQEELVEYFSSIVAEMPLPVMLYNVPTYTKTNVGLDVLGRMLAHPNVVGFKDSSGQMGYFHLARRLFADHPDKTILVGPEELLAECVLLGGHGGVSGGANIFPRLYVDLYEAALAGDLPEVRTLHHRVLRVTDLYRVGRHASATVKGIKCALALMGVCDDFMAEPFQPFRRAERDHVRALLSGLEPHRTDAPGIPDGAGL